jgi:flagellar hook-basal body complex protein FliE
MSPVGPVNSALNALPLTRVEGPAPGLPIGADSLSTSAAQPSGFGKMLDGMVSMVDGKSAQADELTRRVLLGQSDQLHQSVIAIQEASTALNLMVQVRNKLVDSYQELMRMQV